MDEAWKQIVAEALAVELKTSDGPVPGAKLRQLILRVAKRRALTYPPTGHEQESFGDFLKHFESIALVRRREGRDLVVAPADMPQLLADAPESGGTRLREDIFEAFTRIPRGLPPSEPWYVLSDDTVVWLLPTELSGSGELVKIPAATLELELRERKSFIQSVDLAEDVKNRLAESLDTHSGLGSFSKLIKAHGLSQIWHRHRFQAVVRRSRAWCTAAGVPWREEWVSSSDASKPLTPTGDDLSGTNQRRLFERLVQSLSDEDLRRISVPLDIVIKLVRE
jgi:hypothetical protein